MADQLNHGPAATELVIKPQAYFTNQSLLHAITVLGRTVDLRQCKGKRVSFTAEWAAVAATDGDFYVEMTDDPRAGVDMAAGTATATWVRRTIVAADLDHTNVTHTAKVLTISTTAGNFHLRFTDCPNFVRLCYVSRAGGAAAQCQAYVSAD